MLGVHKQPWKSVLDTFWEILHGVCDQTTRVCRNFFWPTAPALNIMDTLSTIFSAGAALWEKKTQKTSKNWGYGAVSSVPTIFRAGRRVSKTRFQITGHLKPVFSAEIVGPPPRAGGPTISALNTGFDARLYNRICELLSQ